MSYALAVFAGFGLGILIVGASLIYYHTANAPLESSDGNETKKKRCIKCRKGSDDLLLLLCGCSIHDSCFYDILVGCKVSDLKKFSCRCGKRISYLLIKGILCSRCCVCKKGFFEETCRLECGHRLHKKCFEADVMRHRILGETKYKCPYKLLECNMEMEIQP